MKTPLKEMFKRLLMFTHCNMTTISFCSYSFSTRIIKILQAQMTLNMGHQWHKARQSHKTTQRFQSTHISIRLDRDMTLFITYTLKNPISFW